MAEVAAESQAEGALPPKLEENMMAQDESSLDSAPNIENGEHDPSKMPTKEEILESIKELLQTADLENLTSKIVRKNLSEKFGCDLTARKKEINDYLLRCMKEKEKENRKRAGDNEKSDDSDDDVPPPTKSAKSDDDSGDESHIKKSDEDLARDLHDEEEMGMMRPRRAAAPKPKPVYKSKKKGDGSKKNPRMARKAHCSPELQAFIGCETLPRHEIVKMMWDYLKAHPELKDEKNKAFYHTDEKLMPIFKVKKFRGFGMMKYISKHMYDLHEVTTDAPAPKKSKRKSTSESEAEASDAGEED